MKFYYNGQLIRTSKTRHYKYAIGTSDTGKYPICSETLENAQKALDALKNRIRHNAEENYKFDLNPENQEFLKKFYGDRYDQYDARAAYERAIARVQLAEIVELEER
jgi:hypothetical protein